MEWLFRKHFWIVHLAFLALAAILLASGANLLFELWIASQTPASTQSPVSRSGNEIRDFDLANRRNLFEARRDLALPRVGGCDNWQAANQSSLSYRLVGTVVFDDPHDSLAFIEDPQRKGAIKSYSINNCEWSGDQLNSELSEILGSTGSPDIAPCNKLGQVVIKRIDLDQDNGSRVYFYNDSSRQCEYIGVASAKASGSTGFQKPKFSQPSGGDQYGSSIKKIGANAYQMDGSDLDNVLANITLVLTQAQIKPAQPTGFRFTMIKPDSVLAKLGFQEGDVLTTINGYEMSPQKALELMQKLQTGTEFNVTGNRGGIEFNYAYTIKR